VQIWDCHGRANQKWPFPDPAKLSGPPFSQAIALRTFDGHFLSVVNGGGLGGPNSGPGAVAIHSDASVVGPWERFYVEPIDATHFALKTVNGNYVTAVNGGGVGGPNDASSPIHTDAAWSSSWERLTLVYDAATNTVTLQTPNGRYLTAVNGGGMRGDSSAAIRTDATQRGAWETFSFEIAK
jgi:hypothetical protein